MRTYTLAAAIASLLLAQPAPSAARGSASEAEPRPLEMRLAQASRGMSAADAAALVGARTGGRVLDVRPEERDGSPGYRVKVLLEGGRVRIVHVDAESGRMSQ